jgi:SRSO17 transposase
LERRFEDYVAELFDGMGRVERRQAMRAYVAGLLLDGERKSIEPMAARLVDREGEAEAMRQRLQQCVSVSNWPDEEVRRRLAMKLETELPGIEALVVDDTGMPKKGIHSVGVARQYSGTLGRTDNCQVAVSLHLAQEHCSACIGMRLYLPEAWTNDRQRCQSVGVPTGIEFAPKWRIALALLDDALAWGVRRHVLLADAGYGEITQFRRELRSRKVDYLVAIPSNIVVWPPGTTVTPPSQLSQIGRPRTRPLVDGTPIAVEHLAKSLPTKAWRKVTWRNGSRGPQSSRYAALRIRIAHKHAAGASPGEEEWLLCEWPYDDAAPTKFYLSSLPATTSKRRLVKLARMRWRVERDYQELKGEIGLDHFEGRTWTGFHHHATLCAVAHAFLALQRALFPPEASALDTRGGATSPAIRAPSLARHVSAVSPARSSVDTVTRTVPYVIG